MTDKLPTLKKVTAVPGAVILELTWAGRGHPKTVDLTGSIARKKSLAPLADLETFAQVSIKDDGRAVTWPVDNRWGEIDMIADTLDFIGRQQQEVTTELLRAWQEAADLSNQEAADAIGVTRRSWLNYREGKKIPKPVQIAVSAMSNPHILAAHFRPRFAGRPYAVIEEVEGADGKKRLKVIPEKKRMLRAGNNPGKRSG